MRILLDESLPVRLRTEMPLPEVVPVTKMGWSALKNGELLRTVRGRFDVFLTADQNLQYQQNLNALPIAVVVLVATSNRLEALMPLMPKLGEVLSTISVPALFRVERS